MADSRKATPPRAPGRGARKSGHGDRSVPVRGFCFGPANYALLAAGLAAIVLGYVLLDGGSVTAAPLLMMLGYAVLLPVGIVLGWRKLESTSEDRPRS